jgi:hypothetical protein
MNSNVLLFSVLYPGMESFWPDYVNSINSQTFKEFDIVLYFDKTNQEPDIKTIKVKNVFPCREKNENKTPAEIRDWGINYALDNNYSILIFADTDDYYSSDRIEKTIYYLHSFDFVLNELNLIDREGSLLLEDVYKSLNFVQIIDNIDLIIDKNLIGFSNSAINTSHITRINTQPDIIAYDWWFYSVQLLKGLKGKLIDDTHTYYRQYNSNSVGIRRKLETSGLKQGIKVKKNHYNALYHYCELNHISNYKTVFYEKLNEMLELENMISDEKFLNKYVNTVNKNYSKIYCGWWSEIISLKKLYEYEK